MEVMKVCHFLLSFLVDQIFIFPLPLSNNCLFIANADCPTVLECTRFRGRKRRINIPQEIGTKYYYFGLHLLDDRNGTRVRNLELEYRQNAERINTEILQEWATGRGKKPVSWETLTEVLRDIELGALASEIEAVKKL